ncbi:hypothetical protein AB990_17835 [Alkalihalobacillus pseudalcaliphilus]|nr:hypothetical protein AB990_17835 [Alkalihalobacillus pseudalcaliphilus]
MAGGVTTPGLVHEVCCHGGLGFLAAGYLPVTKLKEQIIRVRSLGTKVFGVNLFVPNEPTVITKELLAYQDRINHFARAFQIKTGKLEYSDDAWVEKLDLIKKMEVPYVSFTFGCPSNELFEQLKALHIQTIVTVTTVKEAEQAECAGADFVCAQGIEAGGHRGSFINEKQIDEPLTTSVLVERLLEKITIPIIAAGGVMNGKQIKSLLDQGAIAIQLGTAFLCCTESGTNRLHRESLMNKAFTKTELTRAYTGRFARGLSQPFIGQNKDAPYAYPEIHYLTQSLRKEAVSIGRADIAALWAGSNFKQIRAMPAGKLVKTLAAEAGILLS